MDYAIFWNEQEAMASPQYRTSLEVSRQTPFELFFMLKVLLNFYKTCFELLYFGFLFKSYTFPYTISPPLTTECARASAILILISGNGLLLHHGTRKAAKIFQLGTLYPHRIDERLTCYWFIHKFMSVMTSFNQAIINSTSNNYSNIFVSFWNSNTTPLYFVFVRGVHVSYSGALKGIPKGFNITTMSSYFHQWQNLSTPSKNKQFLFGYGERLTLKTSAFQTVYHGNSSFIN